jgi:hypothetical protein
MGYVQSPLFESVTCAAGADYAALSAVPVGKVRYIYALEAYHNIALGSVIMIALYEGTRSLVIQSSADGHIEAAASPGLVGANVNLPLYKPRLLTQNQYIRANANTGAAETITINAYYYEWYPEFEPAPWQIAYS